MKRMPLIRLPRIMQREPGETIEETVA